MAKVILITTREFDAISKIVKPENLIGNTANLLSWMYRFTKVFVEDSDTNILKIIQQIQYSDCDKTVNIANISAFQDKDDSLWTNADTVGDNLLNAIRTKIKTQIDKYTFAEVYFGKIYCIEKDGSYIFVTHEFPDETKKGDRIEYMNAIVSDIKTFLDNKSVTDEQWIFINHDKDWDDSGGVDKDLKDESSICGKVTSAIEKYSILKKIFEQTEHIFIYQHANSYIYKFFIQQLDENVIDNLLKCEADKVSEYVLGYLFDGNKLEDKEQYLIIKDACRIESKYFLNRNLISQIAEYIHNDSNPVKPLIIKTDKSLEELIEMPDCDRRINFIDSSIWLRYSNLPDADNEAIKDIENYDRIQLYKTNNAQEIREFKSRLLLNSRLDKISNHNQHVAPFLFHSETKMRKLAQEEINKLDQNGSLKWRFLLIDDHAQIKEYCLEKDMSKYEDGSILSKCLIVNTILAPYFNIECCKQTKCENCFKECSEHNDKLRESNLRKKPLSDITIYLDCAKTIEDAKKKIGATRYDLILMDYLMDYKKDKNETETEDRYYAYELLKDLKSLFKENVNEINKEELVKWMEYETEEDKRKLDGILSSEDKTKKFLKHWKAPNGKFHFFFISAFTNALNERLLAECLNFHDENWNISRGACPTTTPHLFLFYLLNVMNKQIKELKTNEKDERFITLLNLLKEIYYDKKDDSGNIIERANPREKAITLFNALLQMRVKYDTLKYDACLNYKGQSLPKNERDKIKSPLVNSLFTDIEYYDNAFWEHIIHLVYLTAFGTIRQWSDMWEEYMLIKGKIKDSDLLSNIENYITSLKTNMQ